MTQQHFSLRGHLVALTTIKAKSRRMWQIEYRLKTVEQTKWLSLAISSGLFSYVKSAKHIFLDVRIYRHIFIKDDDDLRASFNKLVIDPLKRKGAIIDDSMKYLTIRSIGQVKCPKEQECIEITVERD